LRQGLGVQAFVLESEMHGGHQVVDHLGTVEQPRSVHQDGLVDASVPQWRHGPITRWRYLDFPCRRVHKAAALDGVGDHKVRVPEPSGHRCT
jgi:hypothetical protein